MLDPLGRQAQAGFAGMARLSTWPAARGFLDDRLGRVGRIGRGWDGRVGGIALRALAALA